MFFRFYFEIKIVVMYPFETRRLFWQSVACARIFVLFFILIQSGNIWIVTTTIFNMINTAIYDGWESFWIFLNYLKMLCNVHSGWKKRTTQLIGTCVFDLLRRVSHRSVNIHFGRFIFNINFTFPLYFVTLNIYYRVKMALNVFSLVK